MRNPPQLQSRPHAQEDSGRWVLEKLKKGAVPLRSLLHSFETEARAAGASSLEITGHAVINPGFTPRLAERFGDTFRQINSETIELTKVLR